MKSLIQPAPPEITSAPDSETLGIDDLTELMRVMNETTRRLQTTHTALRGQVSHLQQELAEANDQLRRSRTLASLGEMAAGIAHEVRNPLGSIQLYAQMLAEDVVDLPEPAALCEKITRAVQGLDAIVRDVLLFSRETMVHPTPAYPEELIDRALESCVSLLHETGVSIRRELLIDDQKTLELDTVLFAQALGNVIRNAIEAITESQSEPRVVTVCIREQMRRLPDGSRAERVVFGVRDTGPGLAPETAERMFNPFFTTRQTGTGLGLAIVHRIIEAHGGHVSVSNPAGDGALVEICLPTCAVEVDIDVSVSQPHISRCAEVSSRDCSE